MSPSAEELLRILCIIFLIPSEGLVRRKKSRRGTGWEIVSRMREGFRALHLMPLKVDLEET
jgi:hypothetical protein